MVYGAGARRNVVRTFYLYARQRNTLVLDFLIPIYIIAVCRPQARFFESRDLLLKTTSLTPYFLFLPLLSSHKYSFSRAGAGLRRVYSTSRVIRGSLQLYACTVLCTRRRSTCVWYCNGQYTICISVFPLVRPFIDSQTVLQVVLIRLVLPLLDSPTVIRVVLYATKNTTVLCDTSLQNQYMDI